MEKRTPAPMTELGVSGAHDPNTGLRYDEFLRDLRGYYGVKKFREMRDNNPIVGAVLTAIEMMLRGTEWRFEPIEENKKNQAAIEAAKFVDSAYKGMHQSFDDFIADALSYLPYGFAVFESVYKRDDQGRIVPKKLSPRAQWTIDRFVVDKNGDMIGVRQRNMFYGKQVPPVIPAKKLIHLRTMSNNNDPAGRSILRNAYSSYYYVKHIETIEAIAIERELNGLPVGRVPRQYLAQDATDNQKAFLNKFETILRDIRKNDQGYVIIPSDVYESDDGTISNMPMVDIKLISSQGTRDIDTDKVVKRHEQNIARTVLADFIMLGQNERGSFALSKNKTELFLSAIQGHTETIASGMNKQELPRLWALNGFDPSLMPVCKPKPVVSVDLREIANFINRLSGAGMFAEPDDELEDTLREVADLPPKPKG